MINNNTKELEQLQNYVEERTPEAELPLSFKKKIFEIVAKCNELGLDGYDYIPQLFDYKEISELAAYGGFPVRYPHYLWGMEFERMDQAYRHGHQKIFEMVVNSDPCYAYLLNSNSEVENLMVIAHAYAHNDFFKNNIWFSKTNRNMMNEMANHGVRIRRYCRKYGRKNVVGFLTLAISLQYLIDPDDVFNEETEIQDFQYDDDTIKEEPRRIKLQKEHEYMDQFINPDEYVNYERKRIKKDFDKKQNNIPENPTRDVLGFIAKQSPILKNWMRDILYMIREEALYFIPQIQTKTINEGWAAYWDLQLMAKEGFAGSAAIDQYAEVRAHILGSKYATNPYKVGNLLFDYIKERWDKGQFGPEWDECKDMKKRKEWDKKLGLGTEKIFEVRKTHNDYMLIDEFLDQDFIDEYEFFMYEEKETGEVIIKSKELKDVKKSMLQNVGLNLQPIIRIKNANHLNLQHLLLEHVWTGQTLNFKYSQEVVKFIFRLWGKPVALMTYQIHENYNPAIPIEINDKIVPFIIYCKDTNNVSMGTMKEYYSEFKR